jgi:hypothetical protein
MKYGHLCTVAPAASLAAVTDAFENIMAGGPSLSADFKPCTNAGDADDELPAILPARNKQSAVTCPPDAAPILSQDGIALCTVTLSTIAARQHTKVGPGWANI